MIVNEISTGSMPLSTSVQLADGGYAVFWSEHIAWDFVTDVTNISLRIFDADGTPRTNEIPIVGPGQGLKYYVSGVATHDGGIFITWTDWGGGYDVMGSDGSWAAVWALKLSLSGDILVPEFQVNQTTFLAQVESDICCLSNGSVVLTWFDESSRNILARLVDADGHFLTDEITVSASASYSPAITNLSSGGFAIASAAYASGSPTVQIGIFDASGMLLHNVGVAASGAQRVPDVIGLSGGGFAVAWQENGADGADQVMVQVFTEVGEAIGAPFAIGDCADSSRYVVSLATCGEGFAAIWCDTSNDSADQDGSAILLQVFSASGAAISAPSLVNVEQRLGDQNAPSIYEGADGTLRVTWTDWGSLTDGLADIRSCVIDPANLPEAPGPGSLNTAPVADPDWPDVTSRHGEVVDIDLASLFTDPDGDALTFSVSGLPEGLSLSETGHIVGTVTSLVGDFPVTVIANDGHGGTTSVAFQWDITSSPQTEPWDFSASGNADVTTFAILAGDAYTGDRTGNDAGSSVVLAPAGWRAIMTTWDGLGARPTRENGSPIAVFDNSENTDMQATVYQELATGRIVVAYRGTDGDGELLDVSVAMGLGLREGEILGAVIGSRAESYLSCAMHFYEDFCDRWAANHPDFSLDSISFTGHSLGGMVAGYMSGVTGAQAMVFDTGPQSAIFDTLDPVMDRPRGYGYLAGGAPDTSGLVSQRVGGEMLGMAVSGGLASFNFLEAIWNAYQIIGEPIVHVVGGPYRFPISLGEAAVEAIIGYVGDRWGDMSVEGTALDELQPGYETLFNFFPAGLGPIALHSSSLLATMSISQQFYHDTDFSQAPGLLTSWFDESIYSSAVNGVRSSGHRIVSNASGISSLFQEVVDASNGQRDSALFTMIEDARQIVLPWAQDLTSYQDRGHFGPYPHRTQGNGQGAMDTFVTRGMSEIIVETTCRATLSDGISYLPTSYAASGGWITFDLAAMGGGLWGGIDMILQGLASQNLGAEAVALRIYDALIVAANDRSTRATLGTAGDDLVLASAHEDGSGQNFRGGGGSDLLVGTYADDTIRGEAGINTLVGGGGADDMFGGNEADLLLGGTQDDVLATMGGRDTLWGEAGADSLDGGNGDDLLYGGSHADTLNGGTGADTLYGGAGADELHGGGGNDVLYDAEDGTPYTQNDTFDGGDGIDTVILSRSVAPTGSGATIDLRRETVQINALGRDIFISIENVEGSNLGDALTGTDGANRLSGWEGSDTLNGGWGADTLCGGSQRDFLYLGDDVSRDVILYNDIVESGLGSRSDVVYNFDELLDVIDLRAIDSNIGAAGDQRFGFASSATANSVWTVTNRVGTQVLGDVNGDAVADYSIMLNGAFTPLSSSNFLL